MLKKSLSFALISCILLNLVACSIVDTAKEKAIIARDGVVSWYESLDFSKFEQGWHDATEFVGSHYAAVMSSEYVANVQSSITELKLHINEAASSARGTAQEAGYLAEQWAADTFNINSIAGGSTETAEVVGSNRLGSVDVTTSYGENASLKYYQTANASAQRQAQDLLSRYYEYCSQSNDPMSFSEYMNSNGYNPETMDELMASLTPVYEGQTRIIPADQLEAATAYLEGRINTLSAQGENAAIYEETLSRLRDRLQAPDGTESTPITYEEIQAVTELAQEGRFDPSDFNIKLPFH